MSCRAADPAVCDTPEILLEKIIQIPVISLSGGFIAEIDTKTVGGAICEIGGGRTKVDDVIDFAVGFACEKKIGDEIEFGDPLGVLYCRDESQAFQILPKLQAAYRISEEKPEKNELIQKIIS